MSDSKAKVLVMYHTRTGNTKKLAQMIVKGLEQEKDVECILKAAPDVTKDDFLSCSAIIAGSPVYFGTMAAELKDVFDKYVGIRKKMGDKVGAAFTTAGNETGGKETTMMSIIQAFLIYGMIIVGDPLDATGHYGVACTEAPDKDTEENAIKLGRRVSQLVKRLSD
jgi:NAD(P)H dehydrogenase (quinone)